MAYCVTLIPGDGTGPELTTAARRVLEATGVHFEWDVQEAGGNVMAKCGSALPDCVLDSIRANKVCLKGPITAPVIAGFRSVNEAIRKSLDLYANVRPAKWMKGVPSHYEGVDLVIFRENTEGLYCGVEHEVIHDVAVEAIRIITRRATERIIRYAFEYARTHGRKKVTLVHKANILKITDGLVLKIFKEVAAGYPELETNDRIIDNMCMQLVQRPCEYDEIVTTNMFGDILSDLTSGLVGGLGVAPGANIGPDMAMFEPIHGSAPKYAGKNKVNPTATILCSALMLRHLGETAAAQQVEDAVASVIADGKSVTYDLKATRNDPSSVGTSQMADAIIAAMA
jgi:isocitrate dehydrogenase (NAD+)